MRTITKIRRSIRAISPVISVLLMIAIAVAASLVAYAWVMGYFGFTTNKVGKAVLIQSVSKDADGNLIIYVQNVGQGPVDLNPGGSVYIFDNLQILQSGHFDKTTLNSGETATISTDYAAPDGPIKVRVVTTDGTPTESNLIIKGGSSLAVPALAGFDIVDIGPQQVGNLFDVSVTALDQFGAIFDFDGLVTLSDTTGTLNPTSVMLTNGAGSTQATIGAASTSVVLTASGGGKSGQSNAFDVSITPPVLNHFGFDPIDNQIVNVAFTVTITAKDQYGDPFPGYSGTNSLSASTGLGTINPDSVAVAGGTWTGQVTLSQTGTDVTLSTSSGSINGISVPFNVNLPAAVLDHFDFTPNPIPDQTTSQAFSITITAKDQYDANFPSFTGTVDLSAASGGTGIPMAPQTSGNFAGASWTGDVTINQAAAGVIITATQSGGTVFGDSSQFTVTNPPAELNRFTFETITGPKTAGLPFSVTINAIDQYDAPFDGFTGTVSLTAKNGADTTITINPTTSGTFTNPSNGRWTGSVTIPDANTGVTITATDSGSGATGTCNSFDVNVAMVNPNVPAPTLTPASPITFGNSVTSSVTISGSAGTPTGTVTFQYSTDSGSNWNMLGSVKTLSGSGSAASDLYTPPASGSNYRFRAVYSGDSNYNPATGNAASLTVNTAQVTYVSAGAGSGSTGPDLTPGYPSSLLNNDLILLQVTVRGDDTPNIAVPTGFTLLYGPHATEGGNSRVTQWIYYKFSTGSEAGTGAVTVTNTDFDSAARMYAFRNVALTSFTEGAGSRIGDDDVILAQPVTTTGTNRLAVTFVSLENNINVGPFTGGSGGTWTESGEFQFDGNDDLCMQLQTATMPSAGTIQNGSYDTGSTSYRWVVTAFALKPR